MIVEAETLPRTDTAHGDVLTVDVLIVGAGISGVGSAYHLQTQSPERSYVILEALETFGGTWRTHTYPGIRSDSDLYTFGYRFKPWVGPPIATAQEILRYMEEVIIENGIDRHIRFGWRISDAEWSSADAVWTVTARRATGETLTMRANFLWMCQGYYHHGQGYTPEWPQMNAFQGQIVHPQTWPSDLDVAGKRVIVIGSGATAATLAPAIANKTAHVTVVQRSPTYFFPAPNRNDFADIMRAMNLPPDIVHDMARRKVLADQREMTSRAMAEPDSVKADLLTVARAFLGPAYDLDTHFTPRYRPWQQRIALIPDGDLFQGIASGKVTMATGQIKRFTPTGLELEDGTTIDADIIVTATGFRLSVLGEIAFRKDGAPIAFEDTITYRGLMFSGVPNLVWVFGYFRASWTLRVDLMGDFVCRLLAHMDAKGARSITVQPRPEDADMQILPWINAEEFNPGYLIRDMHKMPKRGDRPEWGHTQDYWIEREDLPRIDLDGAEFTYR
jgi:cation diffusion facilitator CzcD-associated flavoprotein CzcO